MAKDLNRRSYPFVPRSSKDLQIGDFWAVQLGDARFGCAVVTDLKQVGVGSRKTLVAGLFDWVSTVPPTSDDVEGIAIFAQGLTVIEAISGTGAQVLGRIRLPANLAIGPNYRDHSVGTIHTVWGWKALPRLIELQLIGGGKRN